MIPETENGKQVYKSILHNLLSSTTATIEKYSKDESLKKKSKGENARQKIHVNNFFRILSSVVNTEQNLRMVKNILTKDE